MEHLTIDVWSDIACPWCWIGKRRLERALGRLGRPAKITFHAFELDPNAPRQVDVSVPYVERLARKYRLGQEEAQAMIDRMTATGAEVGLELRFDRITPTSTFDAHRLLAWKTQNEWSEDLEERLFSAYMTEGRDLSDLTTLLDVAEGVGLDGEEAAAVLESDAFSTVVRADEATAQRLGVQGVPFFIVGGKYVLSGAQPEEIMVGVLAEVLEPRAEAEEARLTDDRRGADPDAG